MARNEKTNIRVCWSGRAKFRAHDIGMQTKRTFNQDARIMARKLFQEEGGEESFFSGWSSIVMWRLSVWPLATRLVGLLCVVGLVEFRVACSVLGGSSDCSSRESDGGCSKVDSGTDIAIYTFDSTGSRGDAEQRILRRKVTACAKVERQL